MNPDFFTISYHLSTDATQTEILSYLSVSVLFIIFGVLIHYSKKVFAGIKSRLFNFFITLGVIGILLSFLRWQSINYIGSRISIDILIIWAVVWYLIIAYYTLIKYPKELKKQKAEERFEKYLPKKKKR